MATKLIRIYEDIDGCLNADWNAVKWRQEGDEDNAGLLSEYVMPEFDDFGRKKDLDTPGGWGNYRTFQGFQMVWNSRLIDALNSLENIEWVWTTTWREDALKVGTAMKLLHNPQRVLHPLNGKTEFPSIHWKYEAIVADQEKDPSPFIAIDDEWNHVRPEVTDNLRGLGGLVISPNFQFGITPDHIEEMREYIKKHS